MHNLEDLIPGGSGFQIIQAAEAVNNSAHILTSGFTGTANHELLLTPVAEPFSLLVLASGIGYTAISRRRGRRG